MDSFIINPSCREAQITKTEKNSFYVRSSPIIVSLAFRDNNNETQIQKTFYSHSLGGGYS